MAESPVKHICWIHATYEIISRGRKWLRGINRTPGQKPYQDKILINGISQKWQPEDVREIYAIHDDEISSCGNRLFHKVVLIPVSAEEYAAAPDHARF